MKAAKFWLVAVLAAASRQAQPAQSVDSQQQADQLQSEGGGQQPPDQRVYPNRRVRDSRPGIPDWSHNHPVFPNTVKSPDYGDPDAYGRPQSGCTSRASVTDAVKKINPEDINYGGLLSQWHRQLFEEFFERLTSWLLILFIIAVLSCAFFIYYLDSKLRKWRLIAADVVKQLLNALSYARAYNRQLMSDYNSLVGRMNDEDEARQRTALPTPEEASVKDSTATPTEVPAAESLNTGDAGATNEATKIPQVAAVAFGIESASGFARPGMSKRSREEFDSSSLSESAVEEMLAAANAVAAGSEAAGQSDSEVDLRTELRRAKTQISSLQQKVASQRNEINRQRQALAEADSSIDTVQQ